jgi:hypothetical protein
MKLPAKYFQKDSWGLGIVLATVSPILALTLIYYLFLAVTTIFNFPSFDLSQLILLAVAVNLLWMRYYIVSARLMKTGKSVFLVTFAMIILFFLFLY